MILSISFDLSKLSDNSIIIAVTGYIIVFIALTLLYIVFTNLPKVLNSGIKNRISGKSPFKERKKTSNVDRKEKEPELTGEVNAAIAMALHLYLNQYHDEESHAMTIKRVSRNYSPWSSKIYSVRNNFNRP